MSFWAGVVQGVKDVDVLKEKEALADERQGVRDEATAVREQEVAYRARMDEYKARQQEFADARALAWREEDQGLAADESAYRRTQDQLAADERAAAAAYRAKVDDRAYEWGQQVFWIGQERTDESIANSMMQWDYGVAQDEANAALAAIDKETERERYDFQVERLEQLAVIDAAAVDENGRRYGIAQERLELLDIREDARIAENGDRYAVAQSRIDRLDAQNVERYDTAEGRLDDAQQQEALRLLGTRANPLSLTGGADGGSPSASGPSTTGRSLAVVLARAKNIYGASDEALVPFIGHGLSARAIDEVLNEYQTFTDDFAGKPGSLPSVDEFLSDSKITFTPGAEVTDEMVIAGAKALGVSLTDQYLKTGSTWEDAITAQLTRQAGNGAYDFSTPSTPSTLDFGEVNEITTAATGEVESYLNQRVRNLRKAINDGDMSQAPSLAAAEAALKKFSDGTDTMEAINLVGSDIILPMLANVSADAMGGNNFGKFNEVIAGRTYPNEASVLAAFKNGELSEDSWYVMDKTIYQVNPEGMKSAASGPLVEDGGQDALGSPKGDLPPDGGVTGPLDLTGMSSEDMYAAILSSGLVVGDAIVVDGNVDYVTERTIEAANRLAPAGRNLDADNLIGFNPQPPEVLEGKVHPRDLAGFTGEAREAERQRILEERATPVDLTERALASVEGVTTAADTERERGAKRMGSGGDRASVAGMVAENADLNPPVNIGGISVLSSVVEPYVEDKGEPLTPDEELAVGVEAILKALSGNGMDQGDLDSLIIELKEKFGDERVQVAVTLAQNQ